MRISDWSSDVCSSDLVISHAARLRPRPRSTNTTRLTTNGSQRIAFGTTWSGIGHRSDARRPARRAITPGNAATAACRRTHRHDRSEEHTSELQSLMRISYAVFCLKKKNNTTLTNIAYTKKITRSPTY